MNCQRLGALSVAKCVRTVPERASEREGSVGSSEYSYEEMLQLCTVTIATVTSNQM